MPCCNSRLAGQIVLGLIQALIILTQGSLLNYFIVSHYSATNITYFFFLGDFLCIFIFAGTLTVAYKYLVDNDRDKHNTSQSFIYSPRRLIANYSSSTFGVLPLIYISWAFYALLLLGKISVIFTSSIPDTLKTTDVAGPQLLKVTIALSGIIFLILVESHNWAERDSPRYVYATSVCSKTGIEVLDTVSMLSVMTETPELLLSNSLETVIIVLCGVNFLLPILILYKLSLGEHCCDKIAVPLSLLHTLLHICLIDIPFLGVRLYLWIKFHHNSSIFIMKNVYGIISSVRGIYPGLQRLVQGKPLPHVDEFLPSTKVVYIDESDKGEQIEELRKINYEKSE